MNVQNPAMGSAPNPSITQGEVARLRDMMMAMPLPQLQAYAAQHIHDPNGGIIVGLASQIANAKKSAGVPQQPQSSVAQQAVQGIAPMQVQQAQTAPPALPENQGIGQLPAQNIEGMAGGGIVGYADGGQIGGRMEDGERRFDVAGLTPDSTSVNPVFGKSSLASSFSGVINPFLMANTRSKYGVNTLPTNPSTTIANPYADMGVQQIANQQSLYANAARDPQTSAAPPAPAPAAPPAAPSAAPSAGITGLPNAQSIMQQFGIGKPQSVADNLAMLNQQAPNPETEHTMSLGENVQELKKQALAMGIDPDNSKAFERLDKMDEKAQELLDRKQALSIIQGGLGMIRSGNPFVAIAEGAGQGIKSYGDALDQHQTTQMKLAESRLSLDNAKNAMNMGLFSKAVDNQENAQKRNLEYLMSQNRDAATMTTAQGQNAAMLAGHVIAGQYGYAGQQLSSATQKEIWGERAKAGLERAQIMAQARNHINYPQLYSTISKNYPVGTPQAQIDEAVANHMIQYNMLNSMSNGFVAPPTAGAPIRS